MRKITGLIMVVLICFAQVGEVRALTSYRQMVANLPHLTSLTITAKSFTWVDDPSSTNVNAFIPGTMTDITPGSPTAAVVMNFGDLTNTDGSWGTSQGFALYAANNGNTGAPQVHFTYSDTNNPNSTNPNYDRRHGLGWKVAVGFTKLVYDTPTHNIETPIYTKVLKDVDGLTILPAVLAGGFLRVTFGVYRVPANEDPAYVIDGAEGFTGADLPGPYSGTLTITVTSI